MKTVKFIFSLLTVTLFLSSCTPQALDDDQNTNTVENTQATGDDTAVHNGSKK
jgi:PBP1b-binding outer membrane lipoprotein LpoB